MLSCAARVRRESAAFVFSSLLLTTLSGLGCAGGGQGTDAAVDARDAATDAAPAPALRINELCPDNDGLFIDEVGQADDFIEIYNADSATIDLGGWEVGQGKKRTVLPAVMLKPGDAYL